MLPEKHDRPFGLQEKLAALNEVPGEPPPDGPALWGKLHQRLENKPRKPYAYAYWAAACMLFAIGVFYVQQRNQFKDLGKGKDLETNKISTLRSTIKTNTVNTVVNAAGNEQHKSTNTKAISVLLTNKLQKPYVIKDTALATTTENAPTQTSIALTIQPDTAQQTLAQIPEKKLKVVHINNLGKPTTEKTLMPLNSALTAQTAKPEHRESLSIISFSGNSSDEFIKIRLTPTN